MLHRVLCITSLFCLSLMVHGQRTFTLEGGLASAAYYGDLTDGFKLAYVRPGARLAFSAYVLPTVSVRVGLTGGMITAADSLSDDIGRQRRNLSFRSPLGEASAVVIWELLRDRRFGIRWRKQFHFSPYVLAGVALYGFDPQAQYQGQWISLQPLGTEGQFLPGTGRPVPYSRVQTAIPVGAGLDIRFRRQSGIRIELGYRRLFTDYLDDVSTIYPERAQLEQVLGPAAAALSNRSSVYTTGEKRGNPLVGDSYYIASLTWVYYFDRRR
jgi:hypothetical protein